MLHCSITLEKSSIRRAKEAAATQTMRVSRRLMTYGHNYEVPLNAADRLGGDF